MKNIAVILFNLGGPDSLESVERFLFNLFYDKSIINLPNPIRWILAKIMSKFRNETAKEIYRKIGGSSPILAETIKQKLALMNRLNNRNTENNYDVFIVMRHFKPYGFEVVNQIKEKQFDQIIMLPLYPQFSTTTTDSSINDFIDNLEKYNVDIPVIKSICCYPDEYNFISSHVDLIKGTYDKIEDKNNIVILFSAHGLPEKIIKSGDPYQWQVELTVKNIIELLNIDKLDYKICYQSRVGPVKWIEPYTDQLIEKESLLKKNIIIVPITFVSEHSETLVELDMEYKKIAEENNAKSYHRIKTLSIDDNFIESLANLCFKIVDIDQKKKLMNYSSKLNRICPKEFCKCINNYE